MGLGLIEPCSGVGGHCEDSDKICRRWDLLVKLEKISKRR
jgi:hypothetical protein